MCLAVCDDYHNCARVQRLLIRRRGARVAGHISESAHTDQMDIAALWGMESSIRGERCCGCWIGSAASLFTDQQTWRSTNACSITALWGMKASSREEGCCGCWTIGKPASTDPRTLDTFICKEASVLIFDRGNIVSAPIHVP